jgi:protocatechuate 3,4-dioxygenase beta subunit|tara:strand:+ start:1318 stop:2043 length:726 start_codon:yes stop_codon:yes gene_type:complete
MTIKTLIKKNYEKQPVSNYPDYKSSILRAPKNKKISVPSSISELSGPVFNKHIIGNLDNDLTLNYSKNNKLPIGQKIIVHGRVLDQYYKPLEGVLIEIWQANAGGKYLHMKDKNKAAIDSNFAGCGRYITPSNGSYEFITIKPGAYPYPNRGIEWRPMHIHFSIFGKSFGQRLITQMYFQGDPLIQFCPMVNSITDKKAKQSLVGSLDLTKSETDQLLAYKFDIILRGYNQTFIENRNEGL